MSDRLIIKATFLLDEKLRTNNLKIKMLGEEAQMFVDNGHSRNGTKKKQFKSIRLAAEAAGVPYMTFYMRLCAAEKQGGLGWKVTKAMKQPVRKYTKVEA